MLGLLCILSLISTGEKKYITNRKVNYWGPFYRGSFIQRHVEVPNLMEIHALYVIDMWGRYLKDKGFINESKALDRKAFLGEFYNTKLVKISLEEATTQGIVVVPD